MTGLQILAGLAQTAAVIGTVLSSLGVIVLAALAATTTT